MPNRPNPIVERANQKYRTKPEFRRLVDSLNHIVDQGILTADDITDLLEFIYLTRYDAHTLLRTSALSHQRTPHRNDDDTKIQKNTEKPHEQDEREDDELYHDAIEDGL